MGKMHAAKLGPHHTSPHAMLACISPAAARCIWRLPRTAMAWGWAALGGDVASHAGHLIRIVPLFRFLILAAKHFVNQPLFFLIRSVSVKIV
jgi:hypothetical protein